MSFLSRFFTASDTISKVRTLAVLRELPEDQLRDVGIDPALLAEGVRAWPWRATEDNWDPRTSVFKTSVATNVGNVAVDTLSAQRAENDKTAA